MIEVSQLVVTLYWPNVLTINKLSSIKIELRDDRTNPARHREIQQVKPAGRANGSTFKSWTLIESTRASNERPGAGLSMGGPVCPERPRGQRRRVLTQSLRSNLRSVPLLRLAQPVCATGSGYGARDTGVSHQSTGWEPPTTVCT
jgi:hypothetical protein